jgi:cell shape-determining protein MreC
MNRKAVTVIVILVVLVCGSLLVRDPVSAAEAVRNAVTTIVGAVTTVIGSLTTFFEALFHSKSHELGCSAPPKAVVWVGNVVKPGHLGST